MFCSYAMYTNINNLLWFLPCLRFEGALKLSMYQLYLFILSNTLNCIGDAVMYMNLDGGNGGEACPSIADSSAVSLSQMAFLSMTVSVFSVVARYVMLSRIRKNHS